MKRFLNLICLACVFALSAFGATGDVGVSLKNNSVNFKHFATRVLNYADVTLTAAQLDTLNATPITAVAAPGTGKGLYVEDVFCYNVFGTVRYAGAATLDLRYTDGSGDLVARFEQDFVTASAARYDHGVSRDGKVVINAPLVFYATSDLSLGDGSIKCRITYRTINTLEQ